MSSSYKCVQLNCDFSSAGSSLLEKFAVSCKMDIIFVQDMYSSIKGLGENFTPIEFSGYNLFYSAKSNQIPKAAIYISKSIKASMVSHASNTNCVTCKLSSNNSHYLLSSVYAPPSDKSALTRTKILFDNIKSSDMDCLLLCGDFNAHSDMWSSKSKTDAKGEELEILLLQKNLSIINNPESEPTFDSGRGRSWIDLTIAGQNLVDSISNWRVSAEETLSFHKMILFDLSANINSQTNKPRYNFSDTNWATFNSVLSKNFLDNGVIQPNGLICEISNKNQLDHVSSLVTSLFTATIKSVVKSTTNYKNRTLVSWWSSDINKMRKELNKIRKKSQSTRDPIDLENYRRKRNEFKHAIRDSKSSSFQKYCSTAENPWALIRKLTSSYKPPSIPSLKKSDETFTANDKEICDLFLEKWFPEDDPSEDSPDHLVIREEVLLYLSNNSNSEPPPEISFHELSVIHKISPLKASGHDLIKAIVLQNLSPTNLYVIKSIFDLCLKFGHFPSAWKEGEGSILPKPDRTDVENYKAYRCITLLSVLGKWLEKILLVRLLWLNQHFSFISPHQFGFLPGKSCEDLLSSIVLRIEKAFLENKFVIIIFLDIAGAFDCEWHLSIIKSLIDKGVDKSYIKLIHSYLSNRLIRLKINDSRSQKCLTRSAPQGGGLSPFLWNCDFDEILGPYQLDQEALSQFTDNFDVENNVEAFADDGQVVVVSDSLLLCQQAANDILSQIDVKAKLKKQSFSAVKSKAVVFSKKKIPFLVNIFMGGSRIEVSMSKKVIGVTLDSKLNWVEHIDSQTAKCKRLIFLLNRCCRLKWGLTKIVLRKIWVGCIEPVLLYGCVVWVCALKCEWVVRKLESVQRLFAIKMIRGFKTVSYEAAITISGLPPIISRIHERVLSYAAKHSSTFLDKLYPGSHIDFTLKIASSHKIDLRNYSNNNFIYNNVPPHMFQAPRVLKNAQIDYPTFLNNVINIYTDGSKSEVGTGCAYVIFQYPNSIEKGQSRLSKENSVFQAELLAIRNSLRHLFHLPISTALSNINIFSDSLSSLQSIEDYNTQNPLATEIQMYVRFFSSLTNITLSWCKGHSGVIGNELADFFAKNSVCSPTVPNDVQPFSISDLKKKVKVTSNINWLDRWNSCTTGRQTHLFIPHNAPSHIINFNFSHKVTQILTGHCKLNFYLSNIGKSINPVCVCGKAIDTVSHYLFNCTLEGENRIKTIIKACFSQGIPFPPNPVSLINNIVLFKSLQLFLKNSPRLEF